jgi:putative flippase GtrA
VVIAQAALGLSPFAANALGYVVGLLIGFLLNRQWAFQYSGSVRTSALMYAVAFAGCYSLNLLVLKIALTLQCPPLLAQAVAISAYSVSFFFACKEFVFPQPQNPLVLPVTMNDRCSNS